MAEGAELEYLVLSFLGQSGEPVGSGVICDSLRRGGQVISEATVGRFLRQLDGRGLTERSGSRGRLLTERGRERCTELHRARSLTRSSQDLVRALTAEGLKEVVDVLVARRALEREIARLVALRATEPDLAELEELVSRYELAADSRGSAAADFAFHARLAAITGNRVLQAVTQLIHDQAHSAMIPGPIQQRLKTISAQHRDIVKALRTRNPQQAESAMTAHIDNVISMVRAAWPDMGA